jgi:ornithine cyclodeaminase/alanine dehydrogenase-like protein (mu-crystallin family)
MSEAAQAARLLTRSEVFSLLSWPELIEATQQALVTMATDQTAAAGFLQLRVPGASMHLKAGALMDPAVVAVKANMRPDAGSSAGVIVAFDPLRFTVRAVMDSADLTAMRTAAIAAVAARRLAGTASHRLAVIGAGPVGCHSLNALQQVLDVGEIRLWSRSPGRAEEAASRLEVPVTICPSPAEAADGAGIVLTATPSRQPLLQAGDLSGDVLVLAMGADSSGKRELGDGLLEGAVLVTDVATDAFSVGECSYLPGGREPRDSVELGELLAGQQSLPSGRRIVFDSVGSAIVDAAVTDLVLTLAERDNAGTRYVFGR